MIGQLEPSSTEPSASMARLSFWQFVAKLAKLWCLGTRIRASESKYLVARLYQFWNDF